MVGIEKYTLKSQVSGQNSGIGIKQVIGTSANSSDQFAVAGNLIAYTASGGVVVCELDNESGEVANQRFFCANFSNGYPNAGNNAGFNAYAQLPSDNTSIDLQTDEIIKDSYGYIKLSIPFTHWGNRKGNSRDKDTIGSGNIENDLGLPSKLREKVRTINCLSISPNQTVLAVGETGYQPRILLFSLAPDLSRNPFALIYEHSFGIKAIKFSSDLKLFVSMGLINDGYLNIWKLGPTVSLRASNKCSSIINDIIWNGDYLITLGLRIIKVWNLKESLEADPANYKHSLLKGRSVHLGSLINSNFEAGSILNQEEVLINMNKDCLLLLRLSDLLLSPLDLSLEYFKSFAVDVNAQKIWIGTDKSGIIGLDIEKIEISEASLSPKFQINNLSHLLKSSSIGSPSKGSLNPSMITKIFNFNEKFLLYLSNSEQIKIFEKESVRDYKVIAESLLPNLAGVNSSKNDEILVFSRDGIIKKALYDSQMRLNVETILKFKLLGDDDFSFNALSSVDRRDSTIALGDKMGFLTIAQIRRDPSQYNVIYRTKAHASTVNDILFFDIDGYNVMTTVSRDRMIQIFFKSIAHDLCWDILQTIPLHSGNIIKVAYYNNRLFVCSADRTVSIHRIVLEGDEIRVLQEKIIPVKTTPVNMKIFGNELIVSTSDKNLLVYDAEETLELKRSLKLYSEITCDSLLVENFLIYKNIIITSSSDKSLRIFNYTSGKPLHVCWGHTDPIISLVLRQESSELVSISSDGCLFRWEMEEVLSNSMDPSIREKKENDQIMVAESPMSAKVTRKIISTNTSMGTPPLKPLLLTKSSPRLDYLQDLPERDNSLSPTPKTKLSRATLKRIEARKSLQIELPQSQQEPALQRRLKTQNNSKCTPSLSLKSPLKEVSLQPPFSTNKPDLTSKLRDSMGNAQQKSMFAIRAESELCDKNESLEVALNHLHKIQELIKQGSIAEEARTELEKTLRETLGLLHKPTKENGDGYITRRVEYDEMKGLLETYSEKLLLLLQCKLERSV